MRNIIAIFKRDLSRIRGSVVALIVAVGLVIVPTLYAWFNISGSWDPYGNTGNLKVAVANSDNGYMSDLIPVRVNIGDTVVSALRENDQLDWRFVSESDAVEGRHGGVRPARERPVGLEVRERIRRRGGRPLGRVLRRGGYPREFQFAHDDRVLQRCGACRDRVLRESEGERDCSARDR